jgi:hypothetical protein
VAALAEEAPTAFLLDKKAEALHALGIVKLHRSEALL